MTELEKAAEKFALKSLFAPDGSHNQAFCCGLRDGFVSGAKWASENSEKILRDQRQEKAKKEVYGWPEKSTKEDLFHAFWAGICKFKPTWGFHEHKKEAEEMFDEWFKENYEK